VNAGANVINLSLSIPESSRVLQEATDYAATNGVVVIAAAGNDGQKVALYPAAYDHVIGVGAVDSKNQKASFSNYGNRSVAVVAPGADLYGPYPVPGTMGMAYWSGTSFSTALVTGEAALLFQLEAGHRKAADRVTRTILESATSLEDIDPVYGDQLGRGLIDLYAAVIE
ncbi:MAG: S8 family serine peptidase, partial [Chloroflexi bacterium]|nr:S8 family serine peptidase [Chloroflexota bacterium]